MIQNSEIVFINGRYTGTATTLVYAPLTGSTIENASPTNSDVVYINNGKPGRLVSVSILTNGTMGSTTFTLYNSTAGAVLGTLVFNLASSDTLYNVDFTNGMTTGTNLFNSDIAIGINPATAGNSQRFSVVLERGL